ncbi:hypothetical protein DFJ73DRAFT_767533 [Zopfochytrium polystomum]|nr:hypothetical protein DFJ73DRAFT_767533 [Zopfochytrium polystomum]
MTLATAAVAKSLRRAAAAGHVHVLAWWRHHSPQLLVSGIQSAQLRFAIRSAAANGHVPVLEWCWEHYPDALEQRKSSLEAAADANQAAVVRWFEAIGTPLDEILSLNFSDGALQLAHLVRKRDAGIVIDHQRDATLSTAYNYAQTEVLRWLRDNGVEDVGDGLPDFATSFGQVEVLRWWKREFQPAIGESPPPFFVRVAYYQGYADVLEFWLESGGLGNPLDGRILLAARKGQVAVFEFIAKRGYRMDQSTADQVSEQASENGRVGLLQWLRDNHFPVRFAPETVANACEFGRLDVLDWWKSNGHPFVFDATWSKNGVLFLSRANRDLLDWWENSGLYVQWPSTVNLLSVFSTSSLGKVDALQWWWDKMPKQSPSAGDFLLGVAGDDDSLGWTDETPVVEMADIEWCRRNGLELPARFLSDESLKVRRWKEEVEHVKKFGDTGRSD